MAEAIKSARLSGVAVPVFSSAQAYRFRYTQPDAVPLCVPAWQILCYCPEGYCIHVVTQLLDFCFCSEMCASSLRIYRLIF